MITGKVYLRARKFLFLPLLHSIQKILVLQLGHVCVEVQVPLLRLAEQLLEQQDVGVTCVKQLTLHFTPHGLVHSLNDLLDLVSSEGVIVDSHLLGVSHGGLDRLEALTSLVFGKLYVGDQLGRMVIINLILRRLKNILERTLNNDFREMLPCRQNCRNSHSFTVYLQNCYTATGAVKPLLTGMCLSVLVTL